MLILRHPLDVDTEPLRSQVIRRSMEADQLHVSEVYTLQSYQSELPIQNGRNSHIEGVDTINT